MEPAVYRTQPAEAGRCCGLKSGGEPHALAPNFTDLFVFAFPFSFVVNNASPYLDRLREGETRAKRARGSLTHHLATVVTSAGIKINVLDYSVPEARNIP